MNTNTWNNDNIISLKSYGDNLRQIKFSLLPTMQRKDLVILQSKYSNARSKMSSLSFTLKYA
jgi:hypothetical protein